MATRMLSLEEYKDLVNSITVEKNTGVAKKYLNTENYVQSGFNTQSQICSQNRIRIVREVQR